jgi:hypothetical protein
MTVSHKSDFAELNIRCSAQPRVYLSRYQPCHSPHAVDKTGFEVALNDANKLGKSWAWQAPSIDLLQPMPANLDFGAQSPDSARSHHLGQDGHNLRERRF